MQQFKNIKNELIRRGYGKEEDLKSQVAVLMSVAEMLNGVDLKSKYPVQSHPQPPVLSLTPGLPDVIPAGGVLPFQPAPKLNFPRTVNPFQQMMQMNLQKQLQYQQTFPTMKNLLNTDQVTPNEEVEEPSSSAIAQPAEDSEEEELKCLTEERRAQAFKTTTESIKQELIQKGYGKREDLTSQPAVLMRVAEILNGDDLKAKFPVQPRRKCNGGKMPREEEKMAKATREQIRRNKKNHAIHSLREFIKRKELGDGSGMEQLDVVETILEHIRTLPVNEKVDTQLENVEDAQISTTTSPGLPTLVPTPPLVDQVPVQPPVLTPGLPNILLPGAPLPFQPIPLFKFPLPPAQFPMMPVMMNPAAIQIHQQYQQILQNMKNLQKEEKEASSSLSAQPSEVPMESEEEDVDILN
ncbi:hypothetical protein GCK72_010935 [Caenorhabditis remanei]|uniref:Uncharacterized protein n=1 Tax=Caenorhabditis remanei TaxID=31234 RepID=A0A6A5H837_CAERE|nr:hypothetical protein GCK72_010935 [Caenorhabditis remanei]KAF1762673.1 hypothetical protein GCK72_010935 [Caenorhabditis remanei]